MISLYIRLCISVYLFAFLAVHIAMPDILTIQTSLFIQILTKTAIIGTINRGSIYEIYQKERVYGSICLLSIMTGVFFSRIYPRTARSGRGMMYTTGHHNHMHI